MNKEKIENIIKIYAGSLIIFLFMIIISDVRNETEIYTSEKQNSENHQIIPVKYISYLNGQVKSLNQENSGGTKSETPLKEKIITDNEIVTKIETSIQDLLVIPTKTEETKQEIPVKEIISFDTINKSARESLVNILCTTENSGYFNPISGSGIIIDKKGVILTNAHIAQYFLLRDYIKKDFVTCSIRMGSPSQPLYKAEPLYISEEWITNNYQNITQQNYSENGESDYAFLLITETINNENKLLNEFPRTDYDTEENTIEVGANVLLAGYPAGFLGGITIQKDLNITTTIKQIKKLYTFSEQTLDLISLGASLLAQKGSSGGAVVNNQNKLVGLIVTTTESKLTQERDLRAITLAHINRDLQKQIDFDIKNFLSFNLLAISKSFSEIKAPYLKNLLITALEK